MLQDIAPKQMHVAYKNKKAELDDYIVVVKGPELIVGGDDHQCVFPTLRQLKASVNIDHDDLMYLFAVDEDHYYLYVGGDQASFNNLEKAGYSTMGRRTLYEGYPEEVGYIGYTAGHIHDWYFSNQFCGKCGVTMSLRDEERVMKCPSCETMKYPQINPVVIVGIQDGDRLLLTKYANSQYNRYALVAGFVEIGETLEDAVRREVMEEVGLRVKNIRYYASQPWGITGGLMAGFFADLDGDNTIQLDTEELKEGSWLTREEIQEVSEGEKSLTRTMMHEWCKQ